MASDECESKVVNRSHFRRIDLLGLFFLSASAVWAQLPTATILGVVQDSTGAVVPGATLTSLHVNTGQTRTSTTAADGSYRLSALQVGSYELRVEHPGFQVAIRRGLTLAVSQEAVVNFALQVGTFEQATSVTAEAPLVNTTAGYQGGLVNDRMMADLPLNGRNYADLSLLQPGIGEHKNHGNLAGLIGTWFSSNGAPVRSNNYLLDGAILQNVHGTVSASVSGATLGVEGIREFRLITNSPGAEYGMTMGSQMVMVSQNGTNDLHGSLFEYLRNSSLDARNFFDYQTPASSRRLPSFQRSDFGGSVGGPVRQDKLFSHLVYEGVRERLGRTIVSNVIPNSAKTAGGVVPQIDHRTKPLLELFPEPNLPNDRYTFPASQPTNENFGQARVDQMLSASDSVFARYTIHDSQQSIPLDYPQFRSNNSSRGQFATLSESHVFSPTLLSTARFSYSRTAILFLSQSGIAGPSYSLVPGREIGVINIGGVTPTAGFGPGTVPPLRDTQNVFTWSADLFHTQKRHAIKFGSLIHRYQQYLLSSTFSQGSVAFANLAAFLRAQPNSYQAVTPGSVLDRTYHYATFGFYAVDDMRVHPNLTLNLGLRYEFHTEPREVRGRGAALRDVQHDLETTLGPPFRNPSLRNFSPRFGFAWDVTGNEKTAVRGGFGLLYDIAAFGSGLVVGTTATPPFSSLSVVTGPAASSLFSIPLIFPVGTAGKSLRTVDYLIQQPHLMQYNLTAERELPMSMTLTVAYGGSRGLNLVKTVEGNPTVPMGLPQGTTCLPRPASQPFDINSPYCWLGGESRTNPNWNNMELKTAGGNSWYNSLQVALTKRFGSGLQFQSSYTWSKTMDETQSQLGVDNNVDSAFGTDPTRRQVDRALAGFDITHNWRLNAIYRLPSFPAGNWFVKFLNGWWMSGILSVRSGYPFTPALTTNRSRSGVNGGGANIDRPDLLPGRKNSNIILGNPDRYYDPSAFAIPPAGFLGTAGRNILRGPGFASLDFSLAKDVPIKLLGDAGNIQFRTDFFNLLNRANFSIPNRTVFAARQDSEPPLATAGRIGATSGASRQIQMSVRILF